MEDNYNIQKIKIVALINSYKKYLSKQLKAFVNLVF